MVHSSDLEKMGVMIFEIKWKCHFDTSKQDRLIPFRKTNLEGINNHVVIIDVESSAAVTRNLTSRIQLVN